MLGRRKHPRFLLAEPLDASLRVRDEVAIQSWDDHQVVVLSPEPLRAEERATLEVHNGARRRVSVRVAESRPEMAMDGAIRHRLVLSIEDHGGAIAPRTGGSEL